MKLFHWFMWFLNHFIFIVMFIQMCVTTYMSSNLGVGIISGLLTVGLIKIVWWITDAIVNPPKE